MTTDLSTLQDDGDILVLDEYHRIVLHIEHDQDTTLADYDGDGFTEKYRHDGRDRSTTPRPSDMDGRAMKLNIGSDKSSAADWIWWQPYDGDYGYQVDGTWTSAKWSQLPIDVRRKEVARITNLLAWGWSNVGLEWQERMTTTTKVHDDEDLWIEVDTEWLGGVDLSDDYGISIPTGQSNDILGDIFSELHLKMAGVRA